MIKSSQKIQPKKKYSKSQEKKSVILHQKDIMEQYLHMVKQELTYTMVGEFMDDKLKGIIPRSFYYIFNKIEEN